MTLPQTLQVHLSLKTPRWVVWWRKDHTKLQLGEGIFAGHLTSVPGRARCTSKIDLLSGIGVQGFKGIAGFKGWCLKIYVEQPLACCYPEKTPAFHNEHRLMDHNQHNLPKVPVSYSRGDLAW